MALEFHARLGVLNLRTSRFILEPNRCLPPVGVSAHKSATTSVSTRGVEARSEARIWRREPTACSLAEMKNKNE